MAEEDFKKGSLGKVIAVGVGAALLLGGGIWLGLQRDAAKMTYEEVANEQKRLFKLPKEEQAPIWRDWASKTADFEMQQQALLQIAWLGDREGIPVAIKALQQSDHRIRGVAAQVIGHFGTPAADEAKAALNKALLESDASDEPQIVWALVELNDKTALERVLKVYRQGHLAKVQRLGGGSAFDPDKLARMATPDDWAARVGDQSPSVRQLIATILSANAEPKFTDALIALVQDSDIDVAREAASGLGRIGDEKARKPLLDALAKADKDSRKKFIDALRNGIGGVGLVMALDAIDKSTPETEWFQTRVIFNALKELADPRAADGLVAYAQKVPQIHWKTEAAMRLAEVGDVRAAPLLASRMRLNTVKIYGDSELIEEKALSRGDEERIVGARMLADLAKLHPDKTDELKAQAEDAVLFWISDMPQPHA
ncbi:MAG: HEAT repeat domain-containing protein, partial [Polyangiaceae bacterium]|nr:HEAT repeat domain-containing protein [Polyangiaceae bacterium]